MPCIGLTSFLRELAKDHAHDIKACQCPVSGKRHFYNSARDMGSGNSDTVSMPCIGQTSFLRSKARKYWHVPLCVNALYRANVISTPLLQNPVFMRVSGAVFARIFLNCQILGYNKAKKWAECKLYFFRYNFDVFYTIIIHQFIRQATSQIQILYAEIIASKTLFSAPYQMPTTNFNLCRTQDTHLSCLFLLYCFLLHSLKLVEITLIINPPVFHSIICLLCPHIEDQANR